MAEIKKNVKVAVIFSDTTKEEKSTLKKAFDAFGVPVDLFPYPSFEWRTVIKDTKPIAVCGSELFQDVCEYSQAHKLCPGIWKLPLPSEFIQKATNRASRIEAVETIKKIKEKLEELQKEVEKQERKLTKEELINLTATTIMDLKATKAEIVILLVGKRTINIVTKKPKKLDRDTFTFDELLAIKLIQDLLGTNQTSVIDKEEKK